MNFLPILFFFCPRIAVILQNKSVLFVLDGRGYFKRMYGQFISSGANSARAFQRAVYAAMSGTSLGTAVWTGRVMRGRERENPQVYLLTS